MNIGDIVVRSYKYPELISGIVVSEDPVYPDPQYTVLWCDGTTSIEGGSELLYLKEVLITSDTKK